MKPKVKAYLKQIESGQIKTDKARILKYIIDNNGGNIIHLRSLLNIKHQTLTARISDLLDDGIIYVKGTFNDGKYSKFAYEPDKEKQKENRKKRRYDKYLQWKSKGEGFKDLIQEERIKEIEVI